MWLVITLSPPTAGPSRAYSTKNHRTAGIVSTYMYSTVCTLYMYLPAPLFTGGRGPQYEYEGQRGTIWQCRTG